MLCSSTLHISGIHLPPRSRPHESISPHAALHSTFQASTYILEVARHKCQSACSAAQHTTSWGSTYVLEVARYEHQSVCSAALRSTFRASTYVLEVARYKRQSACSADLNLTSRASAYHLDVARYEHQSPCSAIDISGIHLPPRSRQKQKHQSACSSALDISSIHLPPRTAPLRSIRLISFPYPSMPYNRDDKRSIIKSWVRIVKYTG